MIQRFKHVIQEVTALQKYETHKQLIKYLHKEFGLKADIEIFMNYIDIYVSDLRDSNTDITAVSEDNVSKQLIKFFNTLDTGAKADSCWVTEYGYVLVIETADEVFEEKLLQENALYYYYYKDVIEQEEIPVRQRNRFAQDKNILQENTETVKDNNIEDIVDDVKDKETVSHETSNVVLDNKFVWFFQVLDKNDNVLDEDIMELDEAIDTLFELNAEVIVATPYVDPNPNDDNVDLVFAENPGVVIVYDGRQ